MRSASWFVLFPASRGPDSGAVHATLSLLNRAILEHVDSYDWVIHLNDKAAITVALNGRHHVLDETREAVALHGTALPDRDVIATYDVRFELTFDAEQLAEVYTPLQIAAERLAKLTGGIVYGNGAFQTR